ncbi:alanine aminotransferase 2-like isoform X1 [Tachysurus ichikawai]
MFPCTRGRLGARSMMSFSPLSPPWSPIRTFSLGRSRFAWGKMAENEALSQRKKVLTIDTMNANVKKVEYAVRGPIVQRAVQLEKELKEVRCLISMLDQSALKALEPL